ncbi:hydrogenase maturation protease [Microbulbifer sp.]|uniref:hydrogenase maturation protease n=1 Tax=Microbulbifer sp. TaxID=1908541 RepID=UPI002585FADC|nr:hydrogenase maturation protease [Microbulbifer sp.]
MPDWTIISLGNRFRGDDSVGPYVLNCLRSCVGSRAECIENGGDMAQLLEQWRHRQVCVVDAVQDDTRSSGDIVCLDGLATSMPQSLCTTSSHGLNLSEAVELGRLTDALPRRLTIYAICGENFSMGCGLTPTVQAAAYTVEQRILQLIQG